MKAEPSVVADDSHDPWSPIHLHVALDPCQESPVFGAWTDADSFRMRVPLPDVTEHASRSIRDFRYALL